jgi:hypothetical protein
MENVKNIRDIKLKAGDFVGFHKGKFTKVYDIIG